MTLFVDASALVAIIAGEEGAADLAGQLDADPDRIVSPMARWEAVVALRRARDYDWRYAAATVDALLALKKVRMVPIGELEGQLALNGFARYGKGMHPAKLNMGDCFAYACAKSHDARLLYKGDDFTQTDLA